MRALAVALLVASALPAQPREFEVASIRLSQSQPNAGTSFNVFPGGRIRITNEPVKLLIRTAFQLQNSQIAGGPSWIETDRYDVEAKTDEALKLTPGALSPLLRALLTTRFGLQFHRETRELPVAALVLDKNGPKLKPKKEDETSGMSTHGGVAHSELVATAATLESLAAYVGNRLGRLVIDKTGLAGEYDFTLEFSSDDKPDNTTPDLVTALRSQLGLRLESQKAPVEILVIDRLQRPTDN